ncbi:MAG: PEP-CTERM sorting domain-containing protein [Emcibacter sp.]|nr:PEP-CTERM sorting domain-containing protein [Emcibacter sp.]
MAYSLRFSVNGGKTFSAVTVTVSVPEPGALTLMGFGLMGLALSRRRRG